jgi:hypothetical protein
MMLGVLKFFNAICLVLLVLSVIITTRWILEAHSPLQEDPLQINRNIQWISWYCTAPLIIIYSFLKLIGAILGRE